MLYFKRNAKYFLIYASHHFFFLILYIKKSKRRKSNAVEKKSFGLYAIKKQVNRVYTHRMMSRILKILPIIIIINYY